MDIDYLIDDVFTKKEPINFPELKSSEMKVFIACFNATKHTIDYFSNDVIDLSVLKATKSMPIVYGKSTLIDGNTYVDRPFSPYQMLEDQKENIVGKVILIDTRDSGTFIQTVCHLIWDKTYIQENSSERVFVIKPTTMSANLLSHSEKVMKKTYTEWYEYALSIKEEMEEFLDK